MISSRFIVLDTLKKYLSLILVIIFFSGICRAFPEYPWLEAFDYSSLLGKFGTIGDTGDTFVGKGEISVRTAFIFTISIIPGIILALGAVSVAAYFGALEAARTILTPLLKPLLGLNGKAVLALIGSLQSSDAGAVLTAELYEKKLISYKERSIFTAFQFSSASSITVFLTGIPAVAASLQCPLLLPLGVIFLFKFFGTNLMRIYVHHIRDEEDRSLSGNICNPKENPLTEDKNALSAFINASRRAFNIGVYHMMPNIILAYLLTAMLTKSGIMTSLGDLFSPLMQFFALPGEAITVLITSWLSGLGGIAVAASLAAQGLLTAEELTILVPAVFLMGGQLQYMGRILAVIGVPVRQYRIFFGISVINALLSIQVMRFLI